MKIDRVKTYSKGNPAPMLWGQLFIAYGVTPPMAIILLLWLGAPVDWEFAAPSLLSCVGLIAVGIKLWMLDAEWVAYHWPNSVNNVGENLIQKRLTQYANALVDGYTRDSEGEQMARAIGKEILSEIAYAPLRSYTPETRCIMCRNSVVGVCDLHGGKL